MDNNAPKKISTPFELSYLKQPAPTPGTDEPPGVFSIEPKKMEFNQADFGSPDFGTPDFSKPDFGDPAVPGGPEVYPVPVAYPDPASQGTGTPPAYPQYPAPYQPNPYAPNQPYAPSQPYAPNQPYPPYGLPQSPPQGWAIASLVLGVISITSCCFYVLSLIFGIAAIVTGVMALRKEGGGKGIAIAGIVTGGIGLLLTLMFILASLTGDPQFTDPEMTQEIMDSLIRLFPNR